MEEDTQSSGSSPPWNEFNLPIPPVITIGVQNSKLDLDKLRRVLEKAIVFYESQKDLEESAAFCSRLLARRNNSFHNMKGYGELRKANSALCRLLRVNISGTLANFAGNLPDFMKTSPFKTELPSLECYNYVLLRLITVQKLFVRITNCCLQSAAYFLKLLSNNFFFDIITVLLSTTARIWKICRNNANQTAVFYKCLLKHRTNFPLHKQQLPTFTLPEELDSIVENSSNELTKQMLARSKAIDVPTINLIEDTGVETATISLKKDSPGHSRTSQHTEMNSFTTASSTKEVDLGVVLSRTDFLVGSKMNVKNLKTLDDILKFIRDEDKKRVKSRSQCVTRNVSDKTWSLLRKKLSKLPTNDNRSAVKLVRNFLRDV